MKEEITWKAKWRIDKFKDPGGVICARLRQGDPVHVVAREYGNYIGADEFEDNVALNEGLQAIIDMICNLAAITPWDNANARVGVGDSSVAPNATQTELLGVNQAYVGMDAGYPARSAQTAEWRGTFGGTEANFYWWEFTVDNGAAALQNLNRAVADKGSKAPGETWALSLSITFS